MNTKQIILFRPRTVNFTPRDLMLAYAKEAKINPVYGKHGELFLPLEWGKIYEYDRWEIDRMNGGINRITVTLKERESE